LFESLSIWLPALIGGIVGLLVGQLSQWFALRRQHKDAIGKALSDVLEIRHRMLGASWAGWLNRTGLTLLISTLIVRPKGL
jgi:hypothetical protein